MILKLIGHLYQTAADRVADPGGVDLDSTLRKPDPD